MDLNYFKNNNFFIYDKLCPQFPKNPLKTATKKRIIIIRLPHYKSQ